MPSTVEDLDAIADELDRLALHGDAPYETALALEKLSERVRTVGTDLTVVGGPRPAVDTWNLDVASPPPDATPSIRFIANHNEPHAAVRVHIGAVDRTHALVGTLRCRESDLAALRGLPDGRTVVSWERT